MSTLSVNIVHTLGNIIEFLFSAVKATLLIVTAKKKNLNSHGLKHMYQNLPRCNWVLLCLFSFIPRPYKLDNLPWLKCKLYFQLVGPVAICKYDTTSLTRRSDISTKFMLAPRFFFFFMFSLMRILTKQEINSPVLWNHCAADHSSCVAALQIY